MNKALRFTTSPVTQFVDPNFDGPALSDTVIGRIASSADRP